ncbi:MAG TPA: sigma-70 family RNA polymerase sigma factor [Bacteroidia bacterium]|nr:sigma-70 family RNA polymerase sigma factor [Bacteroidia bacterium]
MLYASLTDAQLITAFRNGDKKAFPILSKRWSQKLIDFISHKLNDRSHAADVSQDTWLEVLRLFAAGRYHEEGKFFQFLCGIAGNKIKHRYPVEKRYVHPSPRRMEEIGGVVFPAEPDVDKGRKFSVLKNALRKLGCRERTVIVLHFFRGRSFDEIAKRLCTSYDAVTSLCSKGLKQMRKYVVL